MNWRPSRYKESLAVSGKLIVVEGIDISEQFKRGKITFSLFGQKLRGKFKLVRIRSREEQEEENQWLLMKSADGLESEEDLTINRPESVLTGRTNDDLRIRKNEEDEDKELDRIQKNSSIARAIKASNVRNTTERQANKAQMIYANDIAATLTDQQQQKGEFPSKIKPILSTLVDRPFNSKDWFFEIKWDRVRSILLLHRKKGILELKSRNRKSITHRYPELIKELTSTSSSSTFSSSPSTSSVIKCKQSVVLDGEIVVLDKKNGIPNFQSHQRRMNVDFIKEIESLSKEIPATYYFFDILYLDGINLQELPFLERRKILSDVITEENARIKISHYIEEQGQTRAFAEVTGKILLRPYPEKITMEWDTTRRKGKVFFDHNQNARGKTIASVFSARPTESATVSMPVTWNDLSNVLPTDYTILNIPDILNKKSVNP
jgi:bifunctional non-homologous end joining protein LigD